MSITNISRFVYAYHDFRVRALINYYRRPFLHPYTLITSITHSGLQFLEIYVLLCIILTLSTSVHVSCNKLLLYEHYCMSNLMFHYWAIFSRIARVQVVIAQCMQVVMETSDERKDCSASWHVLGLTCEAGYRALHGSIYSKVHMAHCIAQKFSRRGWVLRRTGYHSLLAQ